METDVWQFHVGFQGVVMRMFTFCMFLPHASCNNKSPHFVSLNRIKIPYNFIYITMIKYDQTWCFFGVSFATLLFARGHAKRSFWFCRFNGVFDFWVFIHSFLVSLGQASFISRPGRGKSPTRSGWWRAKSCRKQNNSTLTQSTESTDGSGKPKSYTFHSR